MSEVRDYLLRVIDRTKLKREKFSDLKIPANFSKIKIVPFFGDIRSEFVLSTFLLRRLFEDEYLIVCSWPGRSGLFPTANEYWSVADENALLDLVRNINGSSNNKIDSYERMLVKFFDNVVLGSDLVSEYYRDGFRSSFFDKFNHLEYSLPSIPSVSMSWDSSPKGKRQICLSPTRYVHRWQAGQQSRMLVNIDFWKNLISSLIENDYTPILIQNYQTYDLSPDFDAKCVYVVDNNILAVLGVMRACDCILDVFNGFSRYALIARNSYFVCDERQRYFNTKEFELDDLCGRDIPHSIMYSFAPVVAGHDVSGQLVKAIINNLNMFLRDVNRADLPSTIETQKILSLDVVRKRNLSRIGSRFISIPKIDED